MSQHRTWVTSDTHFGDATILDLDAYGHRIRRPFDDVEEMDRQLVKRWNARVWEHDTVFHLGDIARDEHALRRAGPELNGIKKLILGNHDVLRAGVYEQTGFEIVNGNYSYRCSGGEYVMLSHAPVHECSLTMPGVTILGNIHGHVHEKNGPTRLHLNVSVEKTNYQPIPLEDAIATLRRRRASFGQPA